MYWLGHYGALADRVPWGRLLPLCVENLQHDGQIDWATLEAPLEMKARVAA